ncbi:hypothetical protein ACKW6Q_03485 [Chryseobacterium kwangjuense]|uniref:Uncharacterized protein n=1 Tax=Chryseobacterium kwangjuense TaxID=267125 RepID=A0ABW9K1E5_9FLAO
MEEYVDLDSVICCQDHDRNEIASFFIRILNTYGFKSSLGFIVFSKADKEGMSISYSGGVFNITIYEKYVKFIYDLLYVVLSDDSLFHDIGKASGVIKLNSLNYDFPKTHFDLKCDLEESDRSRFDIDRKELHSFFYKLAIRLVLLHELHHVLNGHSEFLNFLGVKRSRDAVDRKLLENLDLHTLEMDADVTSLQDLIKFTLNDKLDTPKELNNEKGIIKSALFIAFFIFHILPKRRIDSIEEVIASTHPSGGGRFWFMVSALITFYKLRNHELEDFVEDISIEIISNFRIIVKNISNEQLDLKELISFVNPNGEGLEYLGKVTQNWNKLRPFLELFAVKKLVGYTNEFINGLNMKFDILMERIGCIRFSYLSMLLQLQDLIFKLENSEMYSDLTLKFCVDETLDGETEIRFKDIHSFINHYSQNSKISYKETSDGFVSANAHSLRTKVITDLYLALISYFENTNFEERLFNFDWFKILYLLNSTLTQTSKTVHFPLNWKYAAAIKWNGIRIADGQLIFSVKYNDKQIIDLIDCVGNFLQKNKSDFAYY